MITFTKALLQTFDLTKKQTVSWKSLVYLIFLSTLFCLPNIATSTISTYHFLGRQREEQKLQWSGKQNIKFQMAQTECRFFAGFLTWPIRQFLKYANTCG